MAKQATDTFIADLPDGTMLRVIKGDVLADGHAAVRHAPGLFAAFEPDGNGPAEPAKPGRGRRSST